MLGCQQMEVQIKIQQGLSISGGGNRDWKSKLQGSNIYHCQDSLSMLWCVQSYPTNVCERVSVREPVEECREVPKETCHHHQRQTPVESCQQVTREQCTMVQEIVPVIQCRDVTFTLCEEIPAIPGKEEQTTQVKTTPDLRTPEKIYITNALQLRIPSSFHQHQQFYFSNF